jgi:hypothetical protein
MAKHLVILNNWIFLEQFPTRPSEVVVERDCALNLRASEQFQSSAQAFSSGSPAATMQRKFRDT